MEEDNSMTLVSELKGAQLDYWVAKAEGEEVYIEDGKAFLKLSHRDLLRNPHGDYSPSIDWSQGGPIIERERIESCFDHELFLENAQEHASYLWEAWHMDTSDETHYKATSQHGPTPLIAAMRCYVSSKLGDEVPDE